MKDKNKKLMIVVASLLLVIGVSFAYFTVSIILKGEGSKVDFTTATLKGSKLVVEGNLVFDDIDMYPGHQNVSSIKVTATGDNELIPYHVIWEGENGLNTPLNYVVYKTSSKVDVSVQCEKEQEVMNGAKMYYEECSIQNVESLGSVVAEGTIGEGKVKEILVKDEFITASPTGEEVYYYVILEYPNLEESQNGDIGNSFKGEVTVSLSETEPDINIIAAYIEQEDGTYKEVSEIPQSGYTLNIEKSVCNNGATVGWDYDDDSIKVKSLTKSGTSCYLYFDEQLCTGRACNIILSNKNIAVRTDFSTVLTEDTTGTVYLANTSKGTTYYFAGNPTDNWVKFAGFYWRIIRINEDGTLRLIYSGKDKPEITGTIAVGGGDFSGRIGDNAYVGYMYSVGSLRGLGTSSMIKDSLDSWYQNNLLNYKSKIDGNAGFCGDRTPSTSSDSINNSGGTGKITTYYAAYVRLWTDKLPTFECSDSSDLYTTSGSNAGNGALTYPIGLISADEVAFAGGVRGLSNTNYYLYTGQYYWTMSPWFCRSEDGRAMVARINDDGSIDGGWVENMSHGYRPVINVKSDVQLVGTGTSSDPYVVVGAE